MKDKIFATSGTLGVISSAFLLNACTSSDSVDELNQKLEAYHDVNTDSLGYQICIPTSSLSKQYLTFLSKLSLEIKKDPCVARKFAKDPQAYSKKFGFNEHISLDNGLLKIIIALGDDDIIKSIEQGNASKYVQILKQKGLLNLDSLKNDPYLDEISTMLEKREEFNAPLKNMNLNTRAIQHHDQAEFASAVYGAVAIVVAAIAVEAFLWIGTTTWKTHVHGKVVDNESITTSKIYKDNNKAIQVWDLKQSAAKTYIPTDNVNEALVEEGMNVIRENYPEIYNKINKQELRNLILLNIAKNE